MKKKPGKYLYVEETKCVVLLNNLFIVTTHAQETYANYQLKQYLF